MTTLEIPFGGDSHTVTVNELIVTCENPALQKHIDIVMRGSVKPIVNREHWAAQRLVDIFHGLIISEPKFDPNQGDVR